MIFVLGVLGHKCWDGWCRKLAEILFLCEGFFWFCRGRIRSSVCVSQCFICRLYYRWKEVCRQLLCAWNQSGKLRSSSLGRIKETLSKLLQGRLTQAEWEDKISRTLSSIISF